MPVKLKKGSAAAKAFMAKLRAAKGKPKLKVYAKLKPQTLGAVKKATPKKKSSLKSYHKDTKSHNVNVRVVSGIRKTKDIWVIYGYYPTGKEEVFAANSFNEAKSILKDYKKNEPYVSFKIAAKKEKISGLDKVTRRGKKTIVHYSRMSGIAKMPNFSDPDAAREIELFAENDGDLYRQQRRPILINLSKKYQKGTYDNLKAAKLWRYFIDTAMKKYQKEFGGRGAWHKLLSTSDRQILAEKWAEETRQEFELGNLIH